MQVSNAPSKSAVPFADSGTKNTIPVASQIGVTPGAASFTDGFPPLTMTPLAAGGVPPYGADFNGILNFLSAAVRWAQAGASYPYDAAFASSIGGYPKGAVLANASGTGLWFNLADNNATNPDSGGSNWIALPSGIATASEAQGLANNTHALTPKGLDDAFMGANQSLGSNTFYQKYPGGLLIQGGNVNAATADFQVTFPIAFIAAPISIVVTVAGNNASLLGAMVDEGSLTNFAVRVRDASGAVGGKTVDWVAYGRWK